MFPHKKYIKIARQQKTCTCTTLTCTGAEFVAHGQHLHIQVHWRTYTIHLQVQTLALVDTSTHVTAQHGYNERVP